MRPKTLIDKERVQKYDVNKGHKISRKQNLNKKFLPKNVISHLYSPSSLVSIGDIDSLASLE